MPRHATPPAEQRDLAPRTGPAVARGTVAEPAAAGAQGWLDRLTDGVRRSARQHADDALAGALSGAVRDRGGAPPLLMRVNGGAVAAPPTLRASVVDRIIVGSGYAITEDERIDAGMWLRALMARLGLDDVAAFEPLLEDSGDSMDALEELVAALEDVGDAGVAVTAGRLLRLLGDPVTLAALVAATGSAGPVIAGLATIERAQRSDLATLLTRIAHDLVLPLVALCSGPARVLTLVGKIDDPAYLRALLAEPLSEEQLDAALAAEPRGAVLVAVCTRLAASKRAIAELLALVPDRELLVSLAAGEPDGAVLLEMLEAERDHAAVLALLGLIDDRTLLLAALRDARAVVDEAEAVALIVFLHGAGLLDVLTDADRLRRVVQIKSDAESAGLDPGERLRSVREFDYHAKFAQVATGAAEDARKLAIETKQGELDTLREQRVAAALAKHEKAARAKLSTKHSKGLGQPQGNSKYVAAFKKLQDDVKLLAAEDLESIAKDIESQRQAYLDIDAVKVHDDRKRAYREYYEAVAYERDALAALDVTKHRFGDARRVVTAIGVLPVLRDAALDRTLGVDELERLVAIPQPPRDGLLARVPVTTLKPFAASDLRATLLQRLGVAGIDTATITALGVALKLLDKHIGLDQHAALVALLGAFEVSEIQMLLTLTPGTKPLAFLDRLRPRCADLVALETCLRLARRAKWGQAKIEAVVPAGQPALDAEGARTAISRARANEFDKHAKFSEWVHAIALLVEDGYCTIACGPASWLPGGTVVEVQCTVAPVGATFVLHAHPDAKDTGKHGYGNASKYHLKPVRGNLQTAHMYRPSIPEAVAKRLPSLTQINAQLKS
ncbi:MAG: hypothetical protein Q8O56_05290 [Solirubrobacteraceae bacterium]|nr:hypothetical protein [Solirubrobacteraceae bacterium]